MECKCPKCGAIATTYRATFYADGSAYADYACGYGERGFGRCVESLECDVRRLTAECERLREERDQKRAELAGTMMAFALTKQERDAEAAECDRYRRDHEAMEWLRNNQAEDVRLRSKATPGMWWLYHGENAIHQANDPAEAILAAKGGDT